MNIMYFNYIYVGIDIRAPQAPVITSHPQDVEIESGFTVTLQVTANDTMPLFYQWYYENDVSHGMLNVIVLMPL